MRNCSLAAIVISLLIVMLSLPVTVSAETAITIQSEAGFQNKVKYGEGVPLKFTLTNKGEAFSGDLVVDYSEYYNMGAGYALPIELAEGETKTVQFAVPGLSDDSMYGTMQNQSVFLYEGGWEKGDRIEYSGPKTLRPAFLEDRSLFIATLTDNPDRLLPLNEMSPPGNPTVEVFHLNQLKDFSLPTDPLGYESLDYLVIDEFAYGDLTETVQEAIMQWVRQGGHVVTGPVSNPEGEMGNLSAYLPLQLENQRSIELSGFDRPVSGFEAVLAENAKQLAESDGFPIVAETAVGAGSLIQTAFPLWDEPVTEAEGFTVFLNNLLKPEPPVFSVMTGQPIKDRIAYEIGSVNELFESFAVSGPTVVAVIFFYILLVVPVLYILLKRKDKREYAWIAVPAIALITSVLLFAAGAKDRIANPQIQQTGFFEVDEEGGLNGYYMNTLLSNRGGNYRFEAPAATEMTQYLSGQFSTENFHQSAVIEREAGKTSLTVRDMRYWSVSSIIGHSYIGNMGRFAVDLTVENERLTGTIQNDFPFAIEEAAIWTGTRLLSIGSMAPEEEITVDESIQSDVLAPAAQVGSTMGYQPVANAEELAEARKQAALSISYDFLSSDEQSTYVVGWTNDAVVPVSLAGQRPDMSAVHLLAQPFKPSMNFTGEVSIDTSFFDTEVVSLSPGVHFEPIREIAHTYYMEDGEYELVYSLTDQSVLQQVSFDKLTLSKPGAAAEVSIWNNSKGTYEKVESTNKELSVRNENYISGEGTVKLKLAVRSGNQSPEIRLPKLELEGVVNQ